jgi:tight adherence protein B
VVTIACAALAAAVLCLPGPPGAVRLAGLRPAAAGRSWCRLRAAAAVPALLGAILGLLLAGPGGGVAGLLIAATIRRQRAGRRAATAAAEVAAELAGAVSRMADELASGAHPATALAGTTADGPRASAILASAAAASRLGDDVSHALRTGAEQAPEVAGDLERVAAAWALSERHGVPLAELLAGAQADLRWREAFTGRVRAELAGPRATAAVLTALPVLGLALGQLVGADPLAVLRDGLLGQALLVAGVGLSAAGIAWSEQILRAAVPR